MPMTGDLTNEGSERDRSFVYLIRNEGGTWSCPSMDEHERGEDRRDGRTERGGNGNKFVNAMDDHRHNDCV